MFLDVYLTKGIDASFVSAVMDTVLAIGACYAGYKAKQIWDEKGKDVGHKHVMKILTEVVPTMQVSSSILYNIKLMEIYMGDIKREYGSDYSSLEDAINNKRLAIKEMLSLVDKIKSSSIDEMNRLNDICINLISQINMCGISTSESVAGQMFKYQVNKYNDFTRELMSCCYEINSALHFFKSSHIYNMHGGNYDRMDHFMSIINMNIFDLALSRFSKLMDIDEELKDNLNKMKEGKLKPSDYFDFS
ncbi:hypothetical protein SAMN03159353_101541 [Cedecea sp. NFIX57]|nr:hypothetical protein SAMN03159353_101541 [Cedecea sp. NFIX57]